ncbi:MAG TPA: lanthionine synthetase LanC family protein, partial [Thermoanaerobaculia bacterium]|nr:lanthionine synthetase LanC family protein [Thermoanaerobaculia bacterium]
MRSLQVTGSFVLKEDIVLIPCAELTDDVRRKLSFEEGDYTLSHRHGRAKSQVIDGQTAALLALFREPRTIVNAVIENSRALGKDPQAWLEELLPHLGIFVKSRVLVPAGSRQRKAIRPRYDAGATIAGWEIVRCARFIEDSEIYQLRRGSDAAALKIARVRTAAIKALLKNELAILRHLDGDGIAPRLIDAGVREGRPYLILDWIDGVDAAVAAAQRRHDRASLIDLCASIAEAYAALHARGVLHGDVNPRNIVVGGTVTLLDFGYSRFADRPPEVGRAGVQFYFEPEYLAARREGDSLPSSAAGEQYGVAALLYLLIAGSPYLDFRLEREEMERQTESEPPLPFAARGIPPWPEVEQVLFRALEKDPARRYGSMAAMAAALAEIRDAAVRESLATPVSAEANALLEATLTSFARGGDAFVAGYPPPTASINYGCAGAAVGLLRIAEARSDPSLLALADVWISRAAALAGNDDAFNDREHDLQPAVVGGVTPYHTEAGIHAAAAMIAAARGDMPAQRKAIAVFVAASDKPCPQIDVTLGRSGSLLAAAMLLDGRTLCAPTGTGAQHNGRGAQRAPEDTALHAFGAETMSAIWRELDEHPPVERSPSGTRLGIAHGWAGYFYAALRWCTASGDALPPRLIERLHEYTKLKVVEGRGVYWPAAVGDTSEKLIPGWCNGSAGQVFLFTLVHQIVGDERWLKLAERSAWITWDQPRMTASLCCGSAGRAYALLNLYKHSGDAAWLSRARQSANHAAATVAATSQRPRTL